MAKREGKLSMKLLSWEETKIYLKKYKIPYLETRIFKDKKSAADFAQKIGYPVVLKVSSPDILHKTDIGGVEIDIKDGWQFSRAWDKIISQVSFSMPKAKINGLLVQPQVKGIEIVVGMKKDKVFGPVLMFGLGGIFVEVLKDVSFRVAPVSMREAKNMIKQINGYPILTGFRNIKKVNLEKIQKIIVCLSELCLNNPEIKQIDLNPIIADEKKVWVADAKILF